MDEKLNNNIVIVGAGPAGLSVAYYLLKNTDVKPIILEESEYIGGISRTHNYNGNRMDLGGHRFFTKSKDVMDLWMEIFPVWDKSTLDEKLINANPEDFENIIKNDDVEDEVFLKRRRLSRIYFLKKFFDYPISFKLETFLNMGFLNVMKAGFGYLFSCFKKREENSLEDFYINRFGVPLYKMFFEDYTEKLWGIHPSKIAADWGAQRVKGLSLIKVLKNSILKIFGKQKVTETSLIEEFLYPKKGPGQFYEALAAKVIDMGGKIIFNQKVVAVDFVDNKISSVKAVDKDNSEQVYFCDTLFSSMPVKDLVLAMDNVEEDVVKVAKELPYRDFMTVGLLVNKFAIKNKSKYKTFANIIPDCWIYIQERDVKLGRLQIFNNWSPYMLKNFKDTLWLGLEYFCSEGDEMWTAPDEEFIELAKTELDKIGIIKKDDVLDATLIRVKKAYPAYFGSYNEFDKVKNFLDGINNLYCVGRNGQHRYNNMDHSILTGLEAVRAYLGEKDKTEVWNVNVEKEYHENK